MSVDLRKQLKILEAIELADIPACVAFCCPDQEKAMYLPTEKTIFLERIFPHPVSKEQAEKICNRCGIKNRIFYPINDPDFVTKN